MCFFPEKHLFLCPFQLLKALTFRFSFFLSPSLKPASWTKSYSCFVTLTSDSAPFSTFKGHWLHLDNPGDSPYFKVSFLENVIPAATVKPHLPSNAYSLLRELGCGRLWAAIFPVPVTTLLPTCSPKAGDCRASTVGP